MSWFVYIARCADDTLYTGMTTNIPRRELEHNTDNRLGAKSLRHKRPVKIIYYEKYDTQVEARLREVEIKSWKRKYKLKLILNSGKPKKKGLPCKKLTFYRVRSSIGRATPS